MGLFTTFIAYKVGKRRGRGSAKPQQQAHEGNPLCLNYETFCKNYGSCDGMECEFDERNHYAS